MKNLKGEEVKLCKDCEYVNLLTRTSKTKCRRPLENICLITGVEKRLNDYAEDERENEDGCGLDGKYFKQRKSIIWKSIKKWVLK